MSNTPMKPTLVRFRRGLAVAIGVLLAAVASPAVATAEVPPPTDVVATDRPWDGGGRVEVEWTAPEIDGLEGFQVWRSWASKEVESRAKSERLAYLTKVRDEAFKNEYDRLVNVEGMGPEEATTRADQVATTAINQAALAYEPSQGVLAEEAGPGGREWILVDTVAPDQQALGVGELDPDAEYTFAVKTVVKTAEGKVEYSDFSTPSSVVVAEAAILNLTRAPLFVILALLCGVVLFFILKARGGAVLKIRTIAGLAAVDEAVGRATEMGRPILYINGIQDMDDLQTVAGVTVLGRVAKTAAEYDARIEVPTSRSLVMSAARETVEASYLTAGRSDSYNPDLIYYVTDEQFGFTAYVSGLIVRDKPAACFYMGTFFAESLILAETGNSVGAIQIAGTAMPSQLPFFVAACDYTLIGEEFFAASAYLSGQPEQLGSLKGQDVGKLLVGIVLVLGVALATLGAVTGSESMTAAVDWFKSTVLTG